MIDRHVEACSEHFLFFIFIFIYLFIYLFIFFHIGNVKVMMKQTQIDSSDKADNNVLPQQAFGQYLIRSGITQQLWQIG